MIDRIAIYPGSFDPLTKGHINIIERGVKIFDTVIVAVAHHASKKTLFTIQERVEIIKEIFPDSAQVKVDYFEGLLVDYAKKMGTNTILRGMRTISDFEYEFQMALANKTLYPEIESVFMVTESTFSHISSSLIKEIITLGGSAKEMIPDTVERRLREKLIKQ
ncbi:MAG: pantetheine-phosphate adenylyltransferase [Deltaproteobacteria bacterium]